MRSSLWFLLVGDTKGIRPQKLCFNSSLIEYGSQQKWDGVQPTLPREQFHLPTRNRTMGNPAKLQVGVPVIMKVIDLMPCREAGGQRKNTSYVPGCIRFATWNYVRQVCLLWCIFHDLLRPWMTCRRTRFFFLKHSQCNLHGTLLQNTVQVIMSFCI